MQFDVILCVKSVLATELPVK